MTDTELFAKASLLFASSVQALADNRMQEIRGESPCGWPDVRLQCEIEEELNWRRSANELGTSNSG